MRKKSKAFAIVPKQVLLMACVGVVPTLAAGCNEQHGIALAIAGFSGGTGGAGTGAGGTGVIALAIAGFGGFAGTGIIALAVAGFGGGDIDAGTEDDAGHE